MTPLLLLMVLPFTATAEVPLPSYRDDLSLAAWHQVNDQIESACDVLPGTVTMTCNEPMLERAIEEAGEFQRTLFHDARIEYLIGLAHRYGGRNSQALKHYTKSVRLDPARQDAWHDLGEMHLADGRYDAAREAFQHVSKLVNKGHYAWIGPWRLAEIAAHEGNPQEFEDNMREALRRGFSFKQVIGLSNWREFYADPRIHDSIEKLVTVYGTAEVLKSLEQVP